MHKMIKRGLALLLFGLMAGVVVDRLRRRSLLIATDAANSCLLSITAVQAMLGLLTTALLAVLVFLLGTAAVLQGGVHQSYTADLLPPHLLAAGNVELSQTYTLAQTLGPLLGGILVRLAGAQLAMLANAALMALRRCCSYVFPICQGALNRADIDPRRPAGGNRLGVQAPGPRALCVLPPRLVLFEQRSRNGIYSPRIKPGFGRCRDWNDLGMCWHRRCCYAVRRFHFRDFMRNCRWNKDFANGFEG